MNTVTRSLPSIIFDFSRKTLQKIPETRTAWISPVGMIEALKMAFAAASDKERFKDALDLGGWENRNVELLLGSCLEETELHPDLISPTNCKFIERMQMIFQSQVLKDAAKPGMSLLRCGNAFEDLLEDPFDPIESHRGAFTFANGSVASAPMMEQTCDALYLRRDGFKMLNLPYQSDDGKSYSRLFFLPDNPNGLADLESRLDLLFLKNCLRDARIEKVHMILPKLDLKTEQPLQADLELSEFSLSAGLTDMGDHSLIEKVEHKTMSEDDEEGSISTPRTDNDSAEFLYEFIANRPFHHMMVAKNGCSSEPLVYFCGRAADVTAFSNETSPAHANANNPFSSSDEDEDFSYYSPFGAPRAFSGRFYCSPPSSDDE